MNTNQTIAERFRDLDFHDDTFVGMSILPAQVRGDVAGSVIEIRLSSHEGQGRRVLRFIGCGNLRVALDFDVVASNLPPNTSRVDAQLMRTSCASSCSHSSATGTSAMASYDRRLTPS